MNEEDQLESDSGTPRAPYSLRSSRSSTPVEGEECLSQSGPAFVSKAAKTARKSTPKKHKQKGKRKSDSRSEEGRSLDRVEEEMATNTTDPVDNPGDDEHGGDQTLAGIIATAAAVTAAGKGPETSKKGGTRNAATNGKGPNADKSGEVPERLPTTSGGTTGGPSGGTGGTGGNGGGGGNSDDEDDEPTPAPGPGADIKVLMEWACRMCRGGRVRLNDSDSARIMREFGKFQLSQADREAFISNVAYQGFDPIKTLHRALIIKETRGKSIDVFMRDIYHMCLIFLTRGTNLASMTKKMSVEGSRLVEGLIQDYNLKKGQAPQEDLTLSRVALTFYSATILAAHHSAQHLPIKPSYMSLISPGYPPALMTQAVAAAIPIDKSYSMSLIHAHCLYLIEFAKLINPRMKMQGDTVVLESCLPALRAALSKRNPESLADHLWLLEQVGLVHRPAPDQPEVVTDAVITAAQAFRSRHGAVYII
ncbi:nucleocapsid protein [Lihan tick virus]|uniref:Nucleoprotein n=1 Tax=Lihan tick virus TaxID=1608056 RepID=A0A0B5KY57_9VIRU|nr:nucleocapsid protein [Lihan tick virus]AJG39308.1 nucleocapsid protein [Lihan tick virus]